MIDFVSDVKGQEKNINPSTSEQIVIPDTGYNAITKLTVNPVTSNIDNNIKPNNIKKGITILNVDGNVIEAIPIYGTENVFANDTKSAGYSKTGDELTYIDNYFIFLKSAYNSSDRRYSICKIDNNEVSTLYAFNQVVPSIFIVDVIDNYIYFIYIEKTEYTKTFQIKRLNILNPDTIEDYWKLTLPVSDTQYSNKTYTIDRSLILFEKCICKLDLVNKQIISAQKLPNTDFYVCNNNIFIKDNKIFSATTLATNTLNNYTSIDFVNLSSTKIIVDNSLYYLNSDLSLGELIKSNIFSDYNGNNLIVSLNANYYIRIYDINALSGLSGELLKFDEDTNTFEKISVLSGARLAGYNRRGKQVIFKNNNAFWQYLLYDEDTNNIIGYKINNEDFYREVSRGLSTDKVLSGVQVYNEERTPIIGTMPNNGHLAITPSTESQNIQEGYISGGTISAVDSSIDSNIKAENIKKDITILGVTGTYTGETTDTTE